MKIETHTDGTKWIKCSAENPQKEKSAIVEGVLCRTYHPDARIIDTSSCGSDDEYECPHCKKSWWIEYDG